MSFSQKIESYEKERGKSQCCILNLAQLHREFESTAAALEVNGGHICTYILPDVF